MKTHVKLFKLFVPSLIVMYLFCFSFISGYAQAIKVNSAGQVGIGGIPNSIAALQVVDGTHDYALRALGDVKFSQRLYLYNGGFQTGYEWSSMGCGMSPGDVLKIKAPWSGTNALKVDGPCVLTEGWSYSDGRLKKNIKSFEYNDFLTKFMQIEGKQFEYKDENELKALNKQGGIKFNIDTIRTSDSLGVEHQKTEVSVPTFTPGKKYGFIAEEVKEVFPELVRLDSTTMTYGINYNGFIPMLLEVVKQQQTTIESLKSQISTIQTNCCPANKSLKSGNTINSTKSTTADDNSDQSELYQNSPNPFTETTEIAYYLPQDVSNAALYVYDMQGKQIGQYPIQERGNGSITITGGSLQPGMYMYALIAD
ncbi:MAG: tail fiber domain-containing protein, partial [Bacteroidota bacterium]